MAPDAMIIGVKYDNYYVATDVINGLDWIFHVADSLKVPCVVSLSIGVCRPGRTMAHHLLIWP